MGEHGSSIGRALLVLEYSGKDYTLLRTGRLLVVPSTDVAGRFSLQ
jgi:hypothetical protein